MKINDRKFVGPLSEVMRNFISYKHAQGLKYDREEWDLVLFSEFIVESGLTKPYLPKNIVNEWCKQRNHEKKTTCLHRISGVKQFAKYMFECGYECHIPAFPGRTASPDFTPYIFNQNELKAIFAVSDAVKRRSNPTLRNVMPILLRILYGCGLRISEVVNLKYEDVDLVNGIITIKNTKNNKNRLVPMSPSLTKVCNQYVEKRNSRHIEQDYFFHNLEHKPYQVDRCYRLFREILWASGIPHGGRGKGPRLHDFRHTFAVESLRLQVTKNIDLYALLPILSEYLGHDNLRTTEKYIRLTEAMFPELISSISIVSAFVIPEVPDEIND